MPFEACDVLTRGGRIAGSESARFHRASKALSPSGLQGATFPQKMHLQLVRSEATASSALSQFLRDLPEAQPRARASGSP